MKAAGQIDVQDGVTVRVVRVSRSRLGRGVLLEYRGLDDPPVRRWLREGDELRVALHLRFDQ